MIVCSPEANEEIGLWVMDRVGGQYIGQESQCFGVVQDGKITGGVVYDGWNGASMRITTAGEGKRWITKGFLWMIFDYAFNQAKVNVVMAMISSANEPSLRLCEKVGFKRVAEIDDAYPDGAMVIFSLTKKDCKWVKE